MRRASGFGLKDDRMGLAGWHCRRTALPREAELQPLERVMAYSYGLLLLDSLRIALCGGEMRGSNASEEGQRRYLHNENDECTWRVAVSSTEGPSWGHSKVVLGAIGSLLEPFCGH